MADPRPPRFAGLPPYEAMDQDTESLLGYARLLRDTVYRRLYPTGHTDLVPASSDTMFDEALRGAMQQMIEDQLGALSPAQFVAAYRSVVGDTELAAVLESLAEVRGRDAARKVVLERMQQEARVSGRVRLGDVGRDDVLTVALFDPGRPEYAAKRFSTNQEFRPLQRILQVRVIEPATAEVEIVRDTWTGAIWSNDLRTPDAEALSRGVLGTRPASDPEGPVCPELTLHAPIVFQPPEGPALAPPQLVGYVETLDGTVLLDG